MQVDVKLIPYDQEEKATFWVHKEDKGIQELEGYVESERFRSTVLTCQKGKDIYKINCREICYIDSIQELQYIHTEKEIYTTKQRLYMLEKELPGEFVRISKSAILNMEKVKQYSPMIGGIMMAEFPNGEIVYISRKYLREIRNNIKEGLA